MKCDVLRKFRNGKQGFFFMTSASFSSTPVLSPADQPGDKQGAGDEAKTQDHESSRPSEGFAAVEGKEPMHERLASRIVCGVMGVENLPAILVDP